MWAWFWAETTPMITPWNQPRSENPKTPTIATTLRETNYALNPKSPRITLWNQPRTQSRQYLHQSVINQPPMIVKSTMHSSVLVIPPSISHQSTSRDYDYSVKPTIHSIPKLEHSIPIIHPSISHQSASQRLWLLHETDHTLNPKTPTITLWNGPCTQS